MSLSVVFRTNFGSVVVAQIFVYIRLQNILHIFLTKLHHVMCGLENRIGEKTVFSEPNRFRTQMQ